MFASSHKLRSEQIAFRHIFNALDRNARHRNSSRSFRPVSKGLKIEAVIPSLQGDASSQAPPDLPSYIFKERIVYLGMTLVPSVTELILAELLYLQYEDNSKPIQLYINSTGTSKEGQKYGYDTEAFAIYDTIQYVKPPVHTIVVGTAWGEAAMLLAAGAKVSMSKICYSLYSKKLFTSGTSCCTSVCQHNDKAAHKLFSRTGF
jgi:hypothetical protein